MTIPTIDPSIAAFTWIPPTTNATGLTGYNIGIRSTTASGSVAGTYSILGNVAGAATAKALLSSIVTAPKPDTYAAAIRSVGPVNSKWSPEIQFTVPVPEPSPPTGLSIS